ncbi:hypothetical protein JW916_13470 [Candidatus Sumerlaeota bacterium]|nr:hypothetical protein [Candidatus Sumerlaeota bacterium]
MKSSHTPDRYLQAVRSFADRILECGRDVYGKEPTPLFVDVLDLEMRQAVKWRPADPKVGERVLSNQAYQQVFFRMLDGLTRLTGEEIYKQAAIDATRYALKNLRSNGLIYWGGHATWDLTAGAPGFAAMKGTQHELKCVFPYYELMHEADADETQRYIEAFWNIHVIEWLNLEFSRHGSLGKDEQVPTTVPWDNTYKGGPVFFVGKGLTFINTGTDLSYAAAMLSRLSGDPRPLVWAKRLAHRYVETRNVQTDLGGYQFSISQLPGGRGDRARDQFGDQLRTHYVIEPVFLNSRQVRTVLASAGACKMKLGEILGEEGRDLCQWAVEDLVAYGKHSYDEADNVVHPMLTDGLRLTGLVPEKSGYFGPAGKPLAAAPADPALFWAYALGYRLSGDPFLWRIARSIARGNDLGDIGASPGDTPSMDLSCESSDAHCIFGAIELHRATGNPAFLEFAQRIGDSILVECRQGDFFVSGRNRPVARLDNIESFALLHLYAALRDKTDRVPDHVGGFGTYWGGRRDGKRERRQEILFDGTA